MKKAKDILAYLFEHQTLTKEEAKEILFQIAQGDVFAPSQVASFLTVYNMRSMTVEELHGFQEAMLELCIKLDMREFDPIDLCGTGGDRKDTFNISTLASFVTAGAGVKVAKHGNYGVSSVSGSSNVIEHFGFTFSNDSDRLKRQIDRAGICFLHAPLFHPAMKNVAPIRRELGIKTFFNMLGPLVNPAFPQRQMVGVFSLELARLYGYLFQLTDKTFVILHSLDGYDEISLTSDCKYITNAGEALLAPGQLSFSYLQPEELHGGTTVAESARIFHDILKNKGSHAQQRVVLANAGMAIQIANPKLSLTDAVEEAKISLESGKALKAFQTFLEN